MMKRFEGKLALGPAAATFAPRGLSSACRVTSASRPPRAGLLCGVHNMETSLTDPALWHRIHFGFTITYHYLFPQHTMGWPGSWFIGNGAP
jgi:hypothetical protein